MRTGMGRNLCIATLIGLILLSLVFSSPIRAQKPASSSVIVSDMTFSDTTPNDGSRITISVTIHNNDSQPHKNISLAIAYGQNTIAVYNGLELSVNGSLTLDTNWTAVHGDYEISATPSIDGIVLTDQILRKDLTVSSKPTENTKYRSEYFTLALVAILAFLSPLLAKRLRAPVVVMELLFGMGIGGIVAIIKWQLHWDLLIFGDTLKFLANLGFIVLLFLAGLEFDFQILQERGPGPVIKGVAAFVISYLLAVIFIIPLGVGLGQSGIFMAAIVISTTFVGIVATTLREVGLADMRYRQNIIIMALMADISITLLLVLVPLGAASDIFRLALSLGIYIPVIFLAFYFAYRVGSLAMWHFPQTLSRFFHSKDTSELGVRASFMFLFIFILMTLAFGIEAILGAFLAGMLFSLLFHEGALLSKKLFGLGYGFLIPVFFINIGSQFNFAIFWNPAVLWMVPYIIIVATLNKILPSFLFIKDHSLKKVLAMGLLNSSRLGLMIAAVTLAIQYKLVKADFLSPIILVAMILCLVYPTAFKNLMAKEPKEKGFEEGPKHAPESPSLDLSTTSHEDKDPEVL